MTDWGMSGRRDYYSFHLVDPWSLEETGDTLDVEDGASSITWGVDTDNLCSATIVPIGSFIGNRSPGNRLIRVKHGIELPTGETYDEVLGTFFVNSSRATALYGGVRRTSDCYSTLWRYTQDVLATDVSRPKGYLVADEVREIVEEDGGKLLVMPDADANSAHTMDVWWQIGTNKADLLENLANWTGHELGVNEYGYITWSRYVPPTSRPISYTFEEGVNCVYTAGFQLDDNRRDAVNRVVAHFSQSSVDEGSPYPASDYYVADLPASHRFSYEQTGRRSTYDLDVGQPCAHSDLVSQAERYLYTHCGAQEFVVIEHVGIPGLRVGQRVHYTNWGDNEIGLDNDMTVEQISMTLGPGAMCQTKLSYEV